MNDLNAWSGVLACPLDHTPLTLTDGNWRCPTCGFENASTEVKGRAIPDCRALDRPQMVAVNFQIPVKPLDRKAVAQNYFKAISQDFPHLSRRDIRQQFGTKLDKGIQFYCQQLWREVGTDAVILDLGCGSGGNRRYLQSLGFKNILTVDWIAAGADLLVDAHRLPLASAGFDMVISTAVFEHLYNPFIAIGEIGRVLKTGGCFVGGASFWEGWHGSSYFHLTPDGWNALFGHGGLLLDDVWPGWGIIPAAFSYVLTPGHLRSFGYMLQSVVEGGYRLLRGESGVRKLQLRASGAYHVFAQTGRSIIKIGQ
ncbi:MAG: methyltransferase domain-containing protein [Chloroflexota bacterium]